MAHMLFVILWKHVTVRLNKTNSIILTLLEFIVPILAFLLVIYAKSEVGNFDKTYINESTHPSPISNEELLTRINIASTHVLYAPDKEFAAELIRAMQLKLNMYNENIKRFRTKEMLIDYYNTYDHDGPTVVILFNNDRHTIPQHLDYEIKIYEEGILWNTDKLFSDPFIYTPGIGSEMYIDKAFAAVQVALDTSFIEMTSNSQFNLSLTYQEFPYPPYLNTDAITTAFRYVLPLITLISFLFICPMTLKRIVLEKSSGLKELLKIGGIKSWVLWLGWFINGIVLNAVSIVFIAIILTRASFSDYPIIEHCNVFVLMLFLLLYCAATSAFFLYFSVFFHKATLAMVLGILFWIISGIVFLSVSANVEVMSISVKGLFLLLPNIALYYGFNTISLFEMREANISFYNLFESPTKSYDDLSMGFIMVMLVFDTILYFTLALYFDKIWPGPYGISKPWNFLLNKIWNCISRKNVIAEVSENPLLYNLEDVNLETIIQLKEVTKAYENTVAVSNLNMKIYKGTITSLLGENGAGKSTTMSMLTGLTKATSGNIYINSCSINDDVDLARKKVSICMQHDLLYGELTVMQHLILFGMLKGMSAMAARRQATDLLENTLNLQEKASKFASDLSGGMKRKLSLGIALMGDPEILILDEPTAGIDVEGRREIWELILSFKGKKTILISTHYMEEADYLSDYIAVMDAGTLKCFGTPIYLKKYYDVGYKCAITCNDPSQLPTIRSSLNNFAGIENIDLEENVIYCRFNEDNKKEIVRLFQTLDQNKDEWSIQYKFSSSTLEDVYLKVQNKSTTPKDIELWNSDIDSAAAQRLPTFWVKSYNIFRKRRLFFQKKLVQYLSLVICALAVFILTFTLANSGYADVSKDGTTIPLKLSLYGKTDVYYSISGTNPSKLDEYYKNIVSSSNSLATEVGNVSETIVEKGLENIAHYMKRMIIATEFNFNDDRLSQINLMHANKAFHAAPISINTVMNTLLKYYTGMDYSISAKYTPLHARNIDKQGLTQPEFSNLFLWITLLPIGPLLLISTGLLLPTLEYAKSIRLIDKLFGYTSFDCWMMNFAWDFFYYLLSISLILALIFVIPVHYLDFISMWHLHCVLLLYGIACIPFAYVFTYTDTVESAYAKFLITHIICAPVIAAIFLALAEVDVYDSLPIWRTIFFVLDPHIALCHTLAKFSIKIIANHNWDIMPAEKKRFLCAEESVKNPCCVPESVECADFKSNIDLDLVCLAGATFFFYMFALITTDWLKKYSVMYLRRYVSPYARKTDLTHTTSINELAPILKAENISKTYFSLKPFGMITALKNLSLNVQRGKCQGLLGINGAGKTTSFRILTEEIKPTNGSLERAKGKPFTIGYCPQCNALLDEFTAREILHSYGSLRNQDNLDKIVDKLLDKFGLKPFADKPCGTYSGGNKRKLATCISIIGFPTCILLDEPTSGVDSVSRRELWDIISQIKQRKETGIILTSHNMDECEELCNSVCILKDGVVEINKPIEDLKKQYCVGYVLNIKLKSTNNSSTVKEADETDGSFGIKQYFRDNFKAENFNILGTYNAIMHIRIYNYDWSKIFETAEMMKNEGKYNIEDYWVKEASLGEVLMQVAKLHKSSSDNISQFP